MSEIDPDLIRNRIILINRSIPREEHFLKPITGAACREIYRHMCDEGNKDHVCTLVKDNKGVQVYSCCVGGFYANLENIADPYLLTQVEDGKELFVAVCEYFIAEEASGGS